LLPVVLLPMVLLPVVLPPLLLICRPKLPFPVGEGAPASSDLVLEASLNQLY
jgi:hypothetical protein